MEARIFMKFNVVVNYYIVSFNFKFHGDPWKNACAKVEHARTRDKTCARVFTTRARALMQGSSRNLKHKLTR